jgi:hypothetical protein
MAKDQPTPATAASIPAFDRLIATTREVERKGAKVPYTSLNGNMSSYLAEDGMLVLRLSPSDREAFLGTYGTRLHEAYGIVQKDYVDVPPALLEATDELAPWFAASVAWVGGLPPKPTTRAKRSDASA